MTEENEERLTGGGFNEVVRIGKTVRRPAGPWTPTIHAVLNHLAAAGFRYSPRALGIDEQGREVLTYIPGRPAARPWPKVMTTDAGMRALGSMLRELNDALADFSIPSDAVWQCAPASTEIGAVIRHADVAPWNTIWQGDTLIGLIDWDFAEPAPPLWDLANAARYTVPIFDPESWRACGFATAPDEPHRLDVLCQAYGTDPADALAALAALQVFERERVANLGTAGVAPFTQFLARGDLQRFDIEIARLSTQRARLLGH